MNLIQVKNNGDRQTVSARTLWEFLDKPYRDFNPWFNKYKDYGFEENQDFRAITIKIVTAQGNQSEASDYEITLDMAKELCMLQRNEKGKQARQYFLELERQWNTPEAVLARALKVANMKIEVLMEEKEQLLLEAKPRELIEEPKNTIQKQTFNFLEASKYIGVSPNTLTKIEITGELKCIRIGRRKLYPKASLDKFLNRV